MYRWAKTWCCLLIPLLHSFTVAAEEPVFVTEAPEGFGALLEPQVTSVDVYFGGVFVVSTLASYTPESIEFFLPDQIIQNMDALLDPGKVQGALTGELATNAELICYGDVVDYCGVLEPDIAGVIFDAGLFRADLFVDANLLAVQSADGVRYIGDSTTDFSHIHNTTSFFSTAGGESELSLSVNSIASYRNQSVHMDWFYDENNGLNADHLYWQHDGHQHLYQAGWLESQNSSFTFSPGVDVAGVRYESSLKTRLDLDFSYGTPIQVYLQNRSRVNIRREGRIVASSIYNPGNQILNTGNLPNGAYDLEIEIVDDSGRSETINRFFVKSARIPPGEERLYFLEVGDALQSGVSSRFPESAGEFVLRGNARQRIKEGVGADLGFAHANSESILEGGLYWLEKEYEFQPRLLLGTRGDYGISTQLLGRYQRFSGSAVLRRVWSNNHRDNDFHLISTSLSQYVFSVNHPLYDGLIQTRLSGEKRGDTGSQTTFSLSYERPLVHDTQHQLNLRTEFNRNNDGNAFWVRLEWQLRKDKYQHTTSAQVGHEDQPDRSGVTGNLTYSGRRESFTYKDNQVQLGWFAGYDESGAQLGGSNVISGRRGELRSDLNHRFNREGNDVTLFAVTGTTAVAGNGKHLGWGGVQQGDSGILIDLEGQAEGALFDVLVNRVAVGEVQPGGTQLIPVPSYRDYDVQIADKGDVFVSYENKIRKTTLYPGNVERMSWDIDRVYVYFGKVIAKLEGNVCLDEGQTLGFQQHAFCERPLSLARIEGGTEFGFTDEEGYFQAEVSGKVKQLKMIHDDGECIVELPQVEAVNGIRYLEEDLFCE